MSKGEQKEIISSKSSPELLLIGYACNMEGCDWRISTKPYFEAVREYGSHNFNKHGQTTHAHMTYLYTPKN